MAASIASEDCPSEPRLASFHPPLSAGRFRKTASDTSQRIAGPPAACQPTQPSMAHQVPRSMTYGPSSMMELSTSGLASMDRTRSAPVMNRSDSAMTATTPYANWQSMAQEPTPDYALYSHAPMRRQSTLQSLPETTCLTSGSIAEYSVDDFVNSIQPDNSSTLPLPQHSQQLQLTPQWSSSSDVSSPSTPSTALTTPVTQSSNMSRQGSYNPQFFDHVSMLRVQSDSSCMLPILSEDGTFPCSFHVDQKSTSESAGASHFLNFTGSSSEGFLSSASSVPASAHALASSDNHLSYLAEDMRRSTSATSSEGYSSEVSAPGSTYSRQSQREREIIAQAASRKIAPKAIDCNDETTSLSSDAQMTRIRSEDGSSKTVGVLSKTPYVRPQHPKIKCNYCNERPDGFRGTHELDRHIARAHASRRKGYICIDSSTDKKFLANCKHCRNKKVYGAYYNAAAHLRRAHFHPRKRGRKGKNDEKRGGIGGGDHPPMEYLKQNWIKEVEVDNKPTPESPESSSDNDTSDVTDAVFNPTSYPIDNIVAAPAVTAAAVYPASQQPLPTMPMMSQVSVNSTQYMDYGISIPAEPIVFDNTAFFDPSLGVAPADMSNFQFDAYMGP
ncbi:key lime pathogenicity [Pyrenophora seminiperda CCB06]|uniref:Key lime pathogenicity n=1 Tax=Pyrenophora seminiperda CCB06 TaxID=1302712 RepID=A0A3M7LWL4_9PLEO|nr:key lime pathogenicity [Pyrenophora seminiperda CCB06]